MREEKLEDKSKLEKSYLEMLNEARKDASSPFRALMELNREKRMRKAREKIFQHIETRLGKAGTLIIGVRCKDGIVIGSDRKIVRGGETEYSAKIFEFDLGGKVLFAAEGLTGIRDDFFLLLGYEIRRRRGVDTLYEVKIIVEDIISELTERYRDRIREPYPIGVLMGGLEKVSEGNAVLYYIYSQGYGEQVGFRCTGHGADYAYSLAKFLYGPHLARESTVEEVAKRIAFTIAWVADDVDTTVGGGIDVFMIKDGNANVQKLSQEIVNREIEHARKMKEDICGIFFRS